MIKISIKSQHKSVYRMPESGAAARKLWIIIDGPSNLLNELLAYVLEKEFGSHCLVTSTMSLSEIAMPAAAGRILLLIDCLHRHPGLRLLEFGQALGRLPDPLDIALFNISSGIGLEREAFPKGIKGFFYRHDNLAVFIKGVQALLLGQVWISREVLAELISGRHSADGNLPSGLSKREKEILLHMAAGSNSEEIARKLYISRYTVKTHLYHIYKKVGVSNRFQAALWAARNLLNTPLNAREDEGLPEVPSDPPG